MPLQIAPDLITVSQAIQTLGEEYTGVWQYSAFRDSVPPSATTRAALILLSLVPSYALGRWGRSYSLIQSYPELAKWLRKLPAALEIVTEVNLTGFYLRGTYYDLVKRIMGVQYVSFQFFHVFSDLTYPTSCPRFLRTRIQDHHRIHY